MGVRLPNEAQAYGYWKAHLDKCKRPEEVGGEWIVPDGKAEIVDATPLKVRLAVIKGKPNH